MVVLEQNKVDSRKAAQTYVSSVYAAVQRRNPHEKEFLQATKEVFDSDFTNRVADNIININGQKLLPLCTLTFCRNTSSHNTVNKIMFCPNKFLLI